VTKGWRGKRKERWGPREVLRSQQLLFPGRLVKKRKGWENSARGNETDAKSIKTGEEGCPRPDATSRTQLGLTKGQNIAKLPLAKEIGGRNVRAKTGRAQFKSGAGSVSIASSWRRRPTKGKTDRGALIGAWENSKTEKTNLGRRAVYDRKRKKPRETFQIAWAKPQCGAVLLQIQKAVKWALRKRHIEKNHEEARESP